MPAKHNPGAAALANYRMRVKVWSAVGAMIHEDIPKVARAEAERRGGARIECQDCKAFRDVDVEGLYRFFMAMPWWSCSLCSGRRPRLLSRDAKGAAA